MGFALAYGLRNALPSVSKFRTGLVVALSVAVSFWVIGQFRSITLVPTEAWKEMASLIQKTAPHADKVHSIVRTEDYLALYLPDSVTQQTKFDPNAFADGKFIVADGNFYLAGKERFDPAAHSNQFVRIDLPQVRGKDLATCRQSLWFVPPHAQGVSDLVVERKTGASGQSFQIFATLNEGGPQILNVCSQDNHAKRLPELKMQKETGSFKELDTSSAEQLGNLWRCPIDLPAGTRIRLYFYLRKPADEIPGLGFWITSDE